MESPVLGNHRYRSEELSDLRREASLTPRLRLTQPPLPCRTAGPQLCFLAIRWHKKRPRHCEHKQAAAITQTPRKQEHGIRNALLSCCPLRTTLVE
jgi:hypothetical protein